MKSRKFRLSEQGKRHAARLANALDPETLSIIDKVSETLRYTTIENMSNTDQLQDFMKNARAFEKEARANRVIGKTVYVPRTETLTLDTYIIVGFCTKAAYEALRMTPWYINEPVEESQDTTNDFKPVLLTSCGCAFYPEDVYTTKALAMKVLRAHTRQKLAKL